MSIKKQIKKELKTFARYELKHRSGIERASTLVLTLATLFSLSGLGHEGQRSLEQRVAVLPTMPVFNPAEKNETVRMPIKFDDGLRAPVTVGQ